MKISLLNLISTPVPVLNSLGLDTSVGLSSEDPMGARHASETYVAFASIYSPEGALLERVRLGEIPPKRRRLFSLTDAARPFVPAQDHLAVVHRVPQHLLEGRRLDDLVEFASLDEGYDMFRSLVQYGWPGGAHGSVIYETPFGLNMRRPGRPPSQTLTFTSQIIVSEEVTTYLAVICYAMGPDLREPLDYHFTFFAPDGTEAAAGLRRVQPFSVGLIDARAMLPPERVARWTQDGLASFSFVGGCANGVLMPLLLQVAPRLGAVSVEHTHPSQTYTCPFDPAAKNALKTAALQRWMARWSAREAVPA